MISTRISRAKTAGATILSEIQEDSPGRRYRADRPVRKGSGGAQSAIGRGRASKRQAAPFSKGKLKANPKKLGCKAGHVGVQRAQLERVLFGRMISGGCAGRYGGTTRTGQSLGQENPHADIHPDGNSNRNSNRNASLSLYADTHPHARS